MLDQFEYGGSSSAPLVVTKQVIDAIFHVEFGLCFVEKLAGQSQEWCFLPPRCGRFGVPTARCKCAEMKRLWSGHLPAICGVEDEVAIGELHDAESSGARVRVHEGADSLDLLRRMKRTHS
jgi:hypothetical protein